MNDIRPNVSATLVTLQSVAATPALTVDADGVYHVADIDSLISRIDTVIAHIEQSDLTEDDRNAVRDTRKFTNDFIKLVDRSVIDERARVFDPVNAERKTITDKMQHLKGLLNDKLDAFDQRLRAEKRDAMLAHFNDELLMSDSADMLTGTTFEMIENQSWFNRSASNVKSREALSARLASIVTLRNIGGESMTVEKAVAVLTDNEWDISQALAQVSEDIRLEVERIMRETELENQRQRELEEAEQRGREKALEEARENAARKTVRHSSPEASTTPGSTNAVENQSVVTRTFSFTVTGNAEDMQKLSALMRDTHRCVDKMMDNGDLSAVASVVFSEQ